MTTTKSKPVSEVLSQAIVKGIVAYEDIASVKKLEQFIVHGVACFGWTSIVIQWWAINATMTRHRDLYVAMVIELKWEEEAQKAITKWAPGFLVIS